MTKEQFAQAFMDARGVANWTIEPDPKTDAERVVAGGEFLLLKPCRCGAVGCSGFGISGPGPVASHSTEDASAIAAAPWYEAEKYRY